MPSFLFESWRLSPKRAMAQGAVLRGLKALSQALGWKLERLRWGGGGKLGVARLGSHSGK